MNARQKAKNLKKKIKVLESDNDLMHEIINDSSMMQELYDLYSKPLNITNTTMQFQEYKAKKMIPINMKDFDGMVELTKQALAEDLFEGVKENITYKMDTECMMSTIIASIFIGRKDE